MGLKIIKKAIIAVPVRLNSKRLKQKALADIGGKPMLLRVLEQCLKTFSANNIVLCSDSEKLTLLAKQIGVKSLLTSSNCTSGSERIASVLDKIISIVWEEEIKKKEVENTSKYYKQTLVINVQGDQPFLDPEVINKMKEFCFSKNEIPEVVTPIYKLKKEFIHDPAVVKTLINLDHKAIYFSRAAIPYIRDEKKENWYKYFHYWGHVGIYGYRADILSDWKKFPISKLEKLENLEQLRLIDAGIEVSTFNVKGDFLSIDTQCQLDIARKQVIDQGF